MNINDVIHIIVLRFFIFFKFLYLQGNIYNNTYIKNFEF